MSLETTESVAYTEPIQFAAGPHINASARIRVFELLLVTGSAFATSIISSALRVSSHTPVRNYDSLGFGTGLCHELFALGLLVYVVFRQGRTWSSFSERLESMDVIRGALVIVVATLVSRLIYNGVQYSYFFSTGTWLFPKSLRGFLGPVSVTAVCFQLLNPIFEELIVRAYVMTEVWQLTSSKTLAVLVSVVLQTSYHLYQGWLRAASVGGIFLVSSIYYAKTRRIGPVIFAHLFFDLLALLSHYF